MNFNLMPNIYIIRNQAGLLYPSQTQFFFFPLEASPQIERGLSKSSPYTIYKPASSFRYYPRASSAIQLRTFAKLGSLAKGLASHIVLKVPEL